MAIPTYLGIQCLGLVTEMTHDDLPNAEQVTHYPGTRGVDRIDLGAQQTVTRVVGVFGGPTPEDLGAQAQAIRAMKIAGGYGVLVDTEGIAWADARIYHFRTVGPVLPAPDGFLRRYEIEFRHLGSVPTN